MILFLLSESRNDTGIVGLLLGLNRHERKVCNFFLMNHIHNHRKIIGNEVSILCTFKRMTDFLLKKKKAIDFDFDVISLMWGDL